VRLSAGALDDYLAHTALLLERYGALLELGPDEGVGLAESPNGSLSFELRGVLPDNRRPPATVEIRETWRTLPGGSDYERFEYVYELLDHERDLRRAFHLHDADVFVRRFQVVVHEHCEHPIGTAPCAHLFGVPVRDAFAGFELLVDAWIDPVDPDCDHMQCID
jgi:hypothetical protein